MSKKAKQAIAGRVFFHYGTTNVEWKGKTEQRRVTVAGVLQDGLLKLGRTECSPRDSFTKKIARMIASGRAVKKPINIVEINEAQIAGKIFAEVATTLV